jgi:hypothetical protein
LLHLLAAAYAQVFGRRQRRFHHGLWRPASEKRQVIEGIENAALWHGAMGDLLGRVSSRLIDAKARTFIQGN